MTRSSRKPKTAPETRHGHARAADGVPIAYTLWRRPARELLVLAPGFWRVRLGRENLFLATHFLRRGYDVVALDFRGHGDSGGGYAFGLEEHGDFLAVIDDLVGPGRLYERFSAPEALEARSDPPGPSAPRGPCPEARLAGVPRALAARRRGGGRAAVPEARRHLGGGLARRSLPGPDPRRSLGRPGRARPLRPAGVAPRRRAREGRSNPAAAGSRPLVRPERPSLNRPSSLSRTRLRLH